MGGEVGGGRAKWAVKLGGGGRDVHCGNFFLFKSERYGLALIKHLLSVAAVFGREHAAVVL
jgi:hypothetical protein